MNEKNDFALVRKPLSAVEKNAPGAKHILSGTVADTLALTKKKSPPRIVVRHQNTDVLKSIAAIIKYHAFEDAIVLTFNDSEKAWLELSETDPDLFITDSYAGEVIFQHLLDRKAKYPVIWTSTFITPEWLTLVRESASRGLNVVTHLELPFDIESLVKALETALKTPRDTQPIIAVSAIK